MNRSRPSRLIIPFGLATALVIGAVVTLATGSWWALAAALAVHAVATIGVIIATGRVLGEQDKPDPSTEAKQEQEDRERKPEPRVRRHHKDQELII